MGFVQRVPKIGQRWVTVVGVCLVRIQGLMKIIRPSVIFIQTCMRITDVKVTLIDPFSRFIQA